MCAATALALAFSASPAVAATITVDTTVDDFAVNGNCTLREAVQAANTNTAVDACAAGEANALDTIVLDPGTYELTIAPGVGISNEHGDLDLLTGIAGAGIAIVGAGAEETIIDADGLGDRAMRISTVAGATLDSLTVANGSVGGSDSGGGILSQSPLTLVDARVTGNEATGGPGIGGGIHILGSPLVLDGSRVDGNVAGNAGGGISLLGAAELTTEGPTSIDHNESGNAGGGINAHNAGDVEINPGTTVSNNDAVGVGGGIRYTDTGTGTGDLAIDGATIADNSVSQDPSLILLSSGGGIDFTAGSPSESELRISGATVTGNTVTGFAARGGGIGAAYGPDSSGVTLLDSEVSGNEVIGEDPTPSLDDLEGGGIRIVHLVSAGEPALIRDSTIAGNSVSTNDAADGLRGGGIAHTLGALTLVSSTVSGNDLSQGPAQARSGAGIFAINTRGPTQILNSTLTGNVVGAGPGGAVAISTAADPLTIAQTTIAGNSANSATGVQIISGTNHEVRGSMFADTCTPLLGVDGFNVDAGESCVGAEPDTDLTNAAIDLGPLADNGGPTMTRALLGPSAAFDLVPAAACLDLDGGDLDVDQRGYPRPTGDGCEPGAYERFLCSGALLDAPGPFSGCPPPPPTTTPPPPTADLVAFRACVAAANRALRRAVRRANRIVRRARGAEAKRAARKRARRIKRRATNRRKRAVRRCRARFL